MKKKIVEWIHEEGKVDLSPSWDEVTENYVKNLENNFNKSFWLRFRRFLLMEQGIAFWQVKVSKKTFKKLEQ